jgi:signal transduction histidine kinase
MVATVAHDVRNPLQNIQMGIDLLRREIGGDEDKAVAMGGIEHGVRGLSAIITDLLEYSQPLKLSLSSCPVRDIVEHALRTQANKLGGIVTHLELDQEDREISVDIVKLTAVLVNLISNAAEAMPKGGDLKIRSQFDGDDSEAILRLSIADSGGGITVEHLEKIQEPFFTTKITGTGLGIPICKKIVEAHKGNLSVKSRANEGTTVEIILPVPGPAMVG